MKLPKLPKRTKAAIKTLLGYVVFWLIVYGVIGLGIYVVVVFYFVNLVDLKLIVSLLIVEIPLAVALSIMLGESQRNRLRGAIEHVRAVRDFSHLRIHRFGSRFLIRWYFVENSKTNSAYEAPLYFETLAEHDLIDVVDHETEDKMYQHFQSNGIKFQSRRPKPSELA